MVRSGEPARTGSGKTPWGLIGLLIVVGMFVVFHIAVATASMFAGGQSPSLSESMAAVFDHPSNPVTGLPETAGATGWVYVFVVLYLLLIAAVVWLFRWVFTGNRNTSKKGDQQARAHQATYADVKSTLSREAALARARRGLEQTMVKRNMTSGQKRQVQQFIQNLPDDYVISYLGSREKKPLYGQSEDSTLVVAPPRTGKTMYMAVAKVIDAPGACLATSTRADLLQHVAAPRSEAGSVYVFDMDEISGWPMEVKWNPVIGCEDIEVAMRRGDAWAGAQPIGDDTKNGGFFNSKAGHVLARLLFTAAIGGKSMREVVEWSNNLTSDKPLRVLEDNIDRPGAAMALSYLRSLQTSRAGESVDSVQLTLSNLLEPMALPRVMDRLCCPAQEAFDIDRFLDSHDTVVLMADEQADQGTAPIVSMFASEVMNRARALSQTKAGARFWPPFRMVLDEAANLAAFPEMAKYMADSGGRGIEICVFAQTFSQLRSRWGRDDAETIQTAATVKYYFPGLGVVQEVKDLSELIGSYDKRTVSRTEQARGGASVSENFQERPIMTPKQINEIPTGTAILRYRNQAPIHIKLKPWWERADAAQIQEGRDKTLERCGIREDDLPELPQQRRGIRRKS